MLILLYSIAGLLALAAVAGVWWALLSDRSRGRRRCPKCFQSMDPAIGMICPECGHEIKYERRLYRTRRRWGLAVLLLVLLGIPAFLTGSFAYLRQTGRWADLPNPVAVRLLWLENDSLDRTIGNRMHNGELSRWQSLLYIREVRRRLESEESSVIDSGWLLLRLTPTDNYGYSPQPTVNLRSTLEELEPRQLFDTLTNLIERKPEYEPDYIVILTHLKDVDSRATIALIERIGGESPTTQTMACSALLRTARRSATGMVRRLPGPPCVAINFLNTRYARSDIPTLSIASAFGDSVRDFDGDETAIKNWARARWEASVGDTTQQDLERLPELWLWCRLDQLGRESLAAVLNATSNDDPLVQEFAFYLLSYYSWVPEMERLLRSGLRSSNYDVYIQSIATASEFGTLSKPLVSEILDRLSSLDGAQRHSELLVRYRRMDGSEVDFRDAVVHRLELLYDQYRDRIVHDPTYTNSTEDLYVNADLWYLLEIGLKETRSAAICQKYMTIGRTSPSFAAAIAYAATSGNKREATKFILDRLPDPIQTTSDKLTQERLLTLILRKLADQELLMEHYSNADDEELTAFLKMLGSGDYSTDRIEPYIPLARAAAADESKADLYQSAINLIARYERNKNRSR